MSRTITLTNDYTLSLREYGVAKQLTKPNLKFVSLPAPAKLFMGFISILIVFLLGCASFIGALSLAPQAKASWISDAICDGQLQTTSNIYSRLGGVTESMGTKSATLTFIPSILNDVKNGSRITALEKYGNMAPTFSSWMGYYLDASPLQKTITGTKPWNSAYIKGTLDSSAGSSKYGIFFNYNIGACIINSRFSTTAMNLLFSLPKMVMWVTDEFYGFSQVNSNMSKKGTVLNPVTEAISNIVTGSSGKGGLKKLLYLDWLLPIIVLGAAVVLFQGIVKNSAVQAGGSILWMLISIALSIMFLTNPMFVPKAVDNIVQDVQSSVSDAITSNLTTNNACKPSGVQKSTRQMQCSIWWNTIYIPWVAGQYGTQMGKTTGGVLSNDAGTGILTGRSIHMGHSGSAVIKNPTWPLYQLDSQGASLSAAQARTQKADDNTNWQTDTGSNTKRGKVKGITQGYIYGESDVAYAQLVKIRNNAWAGDLSSQSSAAFMALVGSIAVGAYIITSSILLLMYQFTMLILMIVAPFIFLIGAFPGFGKRIMMGWFETVVSILLKRVVVNILLMVFLYLYAQIFALDAGGYIIKLLLIIVIGFAANSMRKSVLGMFASAINFGGTRFMADDHGERALGFGGRLVNGVIGAAAGAAGGKVALMGMGKQIEEDVASATPNQAIQDAPRPQTAAGLSRPASPAQPAQPRIMGGAGGPNVRPISPDAAKEKERELDELELRKAQDNNDKTEALTAQFPTSNGTMPIIAAGGAGNTPTFSPQTMPAQAGINATPDMDRAHQLQLEAWKRNRPDTDATNPELLTRKTKLRAMRQTAISGFVQGFNSQSATRAAYGGMISGSMEANRTQAETMSSLHFQLDNAQRQSQTDLETARAMSADSIGSMQVATQQQILTTMQQQSANQDAQAGEQTRLLNDIRRTGNRVDRKENARIQSEQEATEELAKQERKQEARRRSQNRTPRNPRNPGGKNFPI